MSQNVKESLSIYNTIHLQPEQTTMVLFESLPNEIVLAVLTEAVRVRGVKRALRLKLVSI